MITAETKIGTTPKAVTRTTATANFVVEMTGRAIGLVMMYMIWPSSISGPMTPVPTSSASSGSSAPSPNCSSIVAALSRSL